MTPAEVQAAHPLKSTSWSSPGNKPKPSTGPHSSAPSAPGSSSYPGLPRDSSRLMIEARYYGIGLATKDDPEVLVGEPFTREIYTAASWYFAEDAYGQWRQAQILEGSDL